MHSKVKTGFFILFAILSIFCLILVNLNGEFRILFQIVSAIIFFFCGMLLLVGLHDWKRTDLYIKLFLPGKFDIINALRVEREDVIEKLKYACVDYLCEVYTIRVVRVLTVGLTPDEKDFFERLYLCLQVINNLESEETEKALDFFYQFDLDSLQYLCDLDEAESCIELGIVIQDFIHDYSN